MLPPPVIEDCTSACRNDNLITCNFSSGSNSSKDLNIQKYRIRWKRKDTIALDVVTSEVNTWDLPR